MPALIADNVLPRLDFRLPLDPARLRRARERIRDYLHEHEVAPQTVDAMVVAIEEAMTNAVTHSGAEDLAIACYFDGVDLVAEVRDEGRGFDTSRFHPDDQPDVLSTGGRGLYLISRLTDDLQLESDGGLTVHMIKKDARAQRARGPAAALEPRQRWVVPGEKVYGDARRIALLDEIDEAFAAFDWEYRCVHVNKGVLRQLHRPPDELIGRRIWDLLPEMYDSPQGVALREAMELGRFSVQEYELWGDWVEVRVYPTSAGVSVFGHEINERKRKERERDEFLAALQASEEKYRSIVETSDEGIILARPDGRIYYLNGRMEEMLGHTAEELLGKSALDVAFEESQPVIEQVRAGLRGGGPVRGELKFRRKDGSPLWTAFNASAIMRDGEHVANLIMHTDITERKLAEEALRKSEGRYRELVQNANSAILRWSRDGEITFINEYAQDLFGWSVDEAIGQDVRILLPGGDAGGGLRDELVDKIVAHPGVYRSSVSENVCRDGRRLWMTWTNRGVLDENGEVAEILAVGSDISDLKRTGEALKESEERYREIVELAGEDIQAGRAGSADPPEAVGIDDGGEDAGGEARAGSFRRSALAAVATLRRHPTLTLLLAFALELGYLVPLDAVPSSRNVLGMPGSLLALTAVIVGAIAGTAAGVASALGGGLLFWITVADYGSKSSLLAAVAAAAIWVMAAIVSSLMANALRDESAKRKRAAVGLARAEAARQAQLAEQRRIEKLIQDVRTERERLLAIIENTEACIVLLDREFNFLIVNTPYARTCGYEPHEMIGLNHFALYPNEENEAMFRAVVESGEAAEVIAKPFEFPDQPERGITYWDWRLAPMRDESGSVASVVFSLVEVTERVRSVQLGDALDEINATIAAHLDQEHIFRAALCSVGDALRCEVGHVARRSGQMWVQTHVWNMPDVLAGERYSSDDMPCVEAAVAGQRPVLIGDCSSDPLGTGLLVDGQGLGAAVAIPLVAGRSGIGCLFFGHRTPRRFANAEIDFAEKVGVALSQALENARLLRNLERVAMTLQENLIHTLPDILGVDFGRVGETAMAPDLVGGDFSDVLVIDDSRVALLIGDVAGKGIRAAGLTETVRTAVAAYLATDDSPAAVLDKTNRLLLGSLRSQESHVTVCLVVVDLTSKTARVASAGHPPPILLSGASCRRLDLSFGLPLATFDGPYADRAFHLAYGDTLVLYTDGVTETRRGGELFGERRLAAAVGSLGAADAQGLAEGLRDAASHFGGGLRDDLQVLVLRLTA